MNTILRPACIALLLSLAGSAFAQKSALKEEISKADRQFGLYAYQEALQTCQLVLKKDPSNTKALSRTGDCYFRMNNPEKAVIWYEKAVKQRDVSPEVSLSYGKALMQTGEYELAREQFINYSDENENTGRHFASMCDFALENSESTSSWTAKNETVNTAGDDLLPALQGSKVVFASFNSEFGAPSKSNGKGNQNWLLSAQLSSQTGQLQKLQALRSELTNTPNEGPVSFSADGSKVVFCRNNFVNGVRITDDANASMSLYTADVDASGKWKNIKPFKHNSINYSTGFPSLSPNGKMLFFASDNKDGYGGWDIYVSVLRDGVWGNPRNLGEPVNTAGNEIAPFYNGQELYFSSDWHPGLGGLDVFSFNYPDEDNAEVINMGTVVNSSSDDYGFVLSENHKIGYLCSNREKGKGNTDIWKLSRKSSDNALVAKNPTGSSAAGVTARGETTAAPRTLKITVVDEDGRPVPKAEVDLDDCSDQKGMTDANGVFKFEELNRTINCNIIIRKSGYREVEIEQAKFGKANVTRTVSLERDARESYSGRIIDSRTRKALPGVMVTVDFGDDEEGYETETNETGQYTLMVEPGETYVVNYSKAGYVSTIERISFDEDDFELDKMSLEPDSDSEEDEDKVEVSEDDITPNSPFVKLVPVKERSKTVAIDQISGYSIQISATPKEPAQSKISNYESFSADGNLYLLKEKNYYKLRLGVFKTRAEADAVLKKIVARKDNDKAFVVAERGASPDLMVKKVSQKPTGTTTTTNFYVIQIDTYNDVKDIKAREYEDLRSINANLFSYRKDDDVHLYLGVWPSQEDAKKALVDVKKLEYSDASVVKVESNDPDIQEFILAGANEKSGTTATQTYRAPDVSKPFLVRVASVVNPDRFNVEELEEYGWIETRPSEQSPGRTLILVGRFSTAVEATRVKNRIVAETKYKDAAVYRDTSTD